MTQSFSSSTSSESSDKRDQSDNPAEIRADVDQTRAAIGEKIDQLQARLDPNRLKQQATETVNEILTDTANSVTEYVRTHRDDMVASVADAARRNPLPTALVGLGLGWLILESMAGSKRHDNDDRWQYERHNLTSGGTSLSNEANMGRSRGEFYEGASGRVGGESYQGDMGRSRGQFTGSERSSADYGTYRAGARAEYQGAQDYDNGKQHGSNPLAKAVDAVKDTVSDVSQELKERVGDVTQGIQERVSGVKDQVSDMSQNIQGRVGDTKDRMGGAMGNMRYQAQEYSDQAQFEMQKAGYRMDEWQQRARYEGQRRREQVVRNLEDNPLIYGAVALAAGAALALFLPSTQAESRVFGEARDQIMDKGREVMETAKSRAQEVVSEIRPELEEKARQLVSDVKEAGKEVVQGAAEELRPVVDKAVEKTKEEAKNVAQEAGIKTEKLTGNAQSSGQSGSGAAAMGSSSTATKPSNDKLVVNRDTLRGQWTQLKGEIKSKWGQLNDDELTRVEGDMDKLIGTLQTRYGYTRERSEQEINDFFSKRKA